jgi:hypothetical protein
LPLSRQPGFLAVIHRRAGTRSQSPFAARFPRRPRLHAVAWFPRWLRASFSLTCVSFPDAPGLSLRSRPVPPASPASKLHSLLRVRSRLARVSPHLPADTLLGLCPSRAFSSHASDSRPARARRLEHESLWDSRHEGSQPYVSGEAAPTQESTEATSSTASSLLKRPARTTSRRRLLLPWPQDDGRARCP